MAFNCFLGLKTQKQGQLPGGHQTRTRGGKGDSVMSILSHLPLEALLQGRIGNFTGGRQHKSLTIVKEMDIASPALLQALYANEVLHFVDIEIYETDSADRERLLNRITLADATIHSVRPHFGPAATGKSGVFEFRITFSAATMAPPFAAASWIKARRNPLAIFG
jgi:type VI secretion system Hcp family effector